MLTPLLQGHSELGCCNQRYSARYELRSVLRFEGLATLSTSQCNKEHRQNHASRPPVYSEANKYSSCSGSDGMQLIVLLHLHVIHHQLSSIQASNSSQRTCGHPPAAGAARRRPPQWPAGLC